MKSFRLACMTLFAAAFCASTAVSAFPEYDPGSETILVYTRTKCLLPLPCFLKLTRTAALP